MQVADYVALAVIGTWIIGVADVVCCGRHRPPTPWKPVGYFRDYVLYERTANGQNEWRYSDGQRTVYPTAAQVSACGTDMLRCPLN
jgi:hypothetical protein